MMSEIDLYAAMRWPIETILSNHPGTIGPALVFGLMAFAGVFLGCLALSFPVALVVGLISVVIESASTLLTPSRFAGRGRKRGRPIGSRLLARGGGASLGLLGRMGAAAGRQAGRGAAWAGQRLGPAVAAYGTPALARAGQNLARLAGRLAPADRALPQGAGGAPPPEHGAPAAASQPDPASPAVAEPAGMPWRARMAQAIGVVAAGSRGVVDLAGKAIHDFPRVRRRLRRRLAHWRERWEDWRDGRARQRQRAQRVKQRGYYVSPDGKQYYYSRHRRSERHTPGDAHG
ncbi:hypothetical protein [Marinivivus vitaminiproducens]|uniref:hypothetical protein n=1 Tax=Marinivivus vitaminiproducens TaxID=3035935 RepID=UPI0027A39423|nr:hypothetical protein P4R82_18155 [Geminicoccaceae bacterium SCSIO 64248]